MFKKLKQRLESSCSSSGSSSIPWPSSHPEPSSDVGHPTPRQKPLDTKYDRQWIDMRFVKERIVTCITEHGALGACSHGKALGWPLYLIDVELGCLVPAQAEFEYIALSYVWGGVSSLQAKLENLQVLQVPGVLLNHSDLYLQIPRTIRDTMGLVAVLGKRYLWVDCLCICQDDKDSKHSQLQIMGDIYQNAFLTVIAADGWDANHGLRGIAGVSEPRSLPGLQSLGEYYHAWKRPTDAVWVSERSPLYKTDSIDVAHMLILLLHYRLVLARLDFSRATLFPTKIDVSLPISLVGMQQRNWSRISRGSQS